MATQKQIQTLTCKALFDDDFRKRLFSNPKKAAAEINITLTSDQIKRIKSLDRAEADRTAQEVQAAASGPQGAMHWA